MSANLPIIKSEAENSFITGLMSGEKNWVWLGMKRKKDKMVWFDGKQAEPLHGALYSAWGTGEPSKNGKEHCAYLAYSSKRWNDNMCDFTPDKGPFVLCQKRA